MVDVFLLLAKKLSANGVESVASQFIVTLNDLEDVHLQTTVDIHSLGVSLAERLRGKVCVAHLGANA